MKYIRLSGLLFLLACYQDLSKLKNGSDASTAGSSGGSTTGSLIILNKSSATITFGATDQLFATVLPSSLTVSWSSLNTNVATVSATGLITATGSGQTQIIAVIAGSIVYTGCTVTVPSGGFTANPAEGATVDTLNSIVITYSEPMNAAALTATNYTLSGAGKGTLSTNPLGITRSGNTYTLLFTGAAANGAIVLTISSSNVKTQGGVTLVNNTLNYISYGWYTFLGGAGGEVIYSVQQTTDGGYIVSGNANANIANLGGQTPLNTYSTSDDFMVVKLTAAGAVSWYTFLGGTGQDFALSMQQTSDGGYIVAGYTGANIGNLGGKTPLNSFSAGQDILVIKLTAAGAVSWYTFVGGAGSDNAQAIRQTTDGGYIVAGNASANIPSLGGQTPLNGYSASDDCFFVKLTATGAVAWYTFLGGAGSDTAKSIQQTADGGYIVAGNATNIPNLSGQTPLYAYSANIDTLVIKMTAAGAVSWYTFVGGAGSEQVSSIQQTSDGGYIMAGNANANIASMGGQTPLNPYSAGDDYLVVKLAAAGTVTWYTFLGGSGTEIAKSIQQTSDGAYITTGYASANIANLGGQTPLNTYAAGNDIFLSKLTVAGAVSWYTFLGGSGSDVAYSIQQTAEGGYIIAGNSSVNIATLGGQSPVNAYSAGFDVLIIKLKSDGRL